MLLYPFTVSGVRTIRKEEIGSVTTTVAAPSDFEHLIPSVSFGTNYLARVESSGYRSRVILCCVEEPRRQVAGTTKFRKVTVLSYCFVGLSPKIVLPTRTISLPALIAASKSALIPILSNNLPSFPHLLPAHEDLSSFSSKSRVARSPSKSGLTSALEWEASHEPMVISPRRWSRGQNVRI